MVSKDVEEKQKKAKALRDRLKKEQEDRDKPKLTGDSGLDSEPEVEAQEIAKEVIPSPFTQANIDLALSQGINIFRGVNLSRISRGEQAAQAGRERGSEAVTGLLEGEPSEKLPARELLDVGTKIGLSAQEFTVDVVGSLARFARLGEKRVTALEKESADLTARIFKGLSFVGSKLPFGIDVNTFNNIIAQNKQIIIDSRETGTLIVSNVRTGAISPEEGLAQLSRINDTINQSESAIHITSRLSLKAYLEGLGTEEAKLIKARTQLQGSRAEILRIAALQAAGKLATGEEILASLT